jgi:hypothetical protein
MAWQLDQLCAKGVRQTIISYPHQADGMTDVGEPPVFSAPWWDFLRWFLSQCRARGMTAGFQDYTLCQPILTEIGRDTPDMEGGQLSCVADTVSGSATANLTAEPGTRVIGAWAYPQSKNQEEEFEQKDAKSAKPIRLAQGRNSVLPRLRRKTNSPFAGLASFCSNPDFCVDLSGSIQDGVLDWTAPDGEWLVVLVFARLSPFDPMHPDSGKLAIGRLYEPFERECPGEVGRTLNLFFQDELDFGSRMPFWSNRLFEAFKADKGYDLRPFLPALWHDLGPFTEKVRLDFSDVVVRRIEACYFEPVYRWHEARGTLFGHDNSGRGKIAEGRQFYGDYFRAMRWYSAPGSDDPKLQGPRAFKGLKVNSSIAHLYRRPRVWNEAFHSSGWGTTPGEVVAALNEDFAYGATVVNLHGLYYSTRGGWWEWAPPDFHFRQPYWEHSQTLNTYCTRLTWLLSQGTHRCDVAIVYPIASLDIMSESPEIRRQVAHTGNGALHDVETDIPQPEESAFGLGKYLFDRACDFDFIDDESVVGSEVVDGEVRVSGEAYRVLILPAMKAVRFETLEKARSFVAAGGLVIAYGCLPSVSDREGRDDPQVASLLQDVFGILGGDKVIFHVKPHSSGGCGMFIRRGYETVLKEISARLVRDVVANVEPLHVLHRQLDGGDLFYVFNPANSPVETLLRVRATGTAEMWDAWTGSSTPVPEISVTEGISTVRVSLVARESKVVVLTHGASASFVGRASPTRRGRGACGMDLSDNADTGSPAVAGEARPTTETLPGPWSFTLHPTLDNRYGDFRLPSSVGMLGPEARRFRYQEEYAMEPAVLEPAVSAGNSPYRPGTAGSSGNWRRADFDDSAWPETTYSFGPRFTSLGPLSPDTEFSSIERRLVLGKPVEGPWAPYAFSLRWGIEKDPFLTDWLSGPHGLKGNVPDEFLDFQCETPGSVWYLRAEVFSPTETTVPLIMGGRCAYSAWLNGQPVLGQSDALVPGCYEPWGIPHYESERRTASVTLHSGANHLLLKLVQPMGQRTRAFVAFARPGESHDLGLRWFRDPNVPRPACPAGPERRAIWFRFLAPPGLQELNFLARGVTRVWVDGRECALAEALQESDGSLRCHATVDNVNPCPVNVAMRVEAPSEFRAGDALPEPVGLVCGEGEMPLGDWCENGLGTYSGQGEYRTEFQVGAGESGGNLVLELGDVAATAEVSVNGKSVATLVAPPWCVDITKQVHPGANTLAIRVANTLANHYSVGIPTPYAFPSQTRSGLIGPVRVLSAIRLQ